MPKYGKNNFVGMTLCFYCNKPSGIVIDKHLGAGKGVSEIDGKVVDMQPCNECAGLMKQGVILITFDPAKSDADWFKKTPPNPYRTGGWFVVTEDGVKGLISGNPEMLEYALKVRWLFIEHEAAVLTGLFEIAKQQKENQ